MPMPRHDISVEPAGGTNRLSAAIGLVLLPLISIFFYGVAGQDKFLLLSPLVLVGYLLVFMWLMVALFKANSVVLPPAFFLWSLFVAYGAGLCFLVEIPFEAKVRMLIVALTIGAYGLWANTWVRFRSSRVILGLLLVFSLLASLYGLINFFKQPEMVLWVERWAEYKGRLASTYICPNHFGHLLQMLLPFCFALLFIPQAGIFLRLLSGYCIIVFPIAIYFTESRASMLGSIAAIGITVLLFALRKNKKLFVFLLIAIPLLSAAILLGGWNTSEMFKRRMTPVVEFVSEAATEGFANTTTRDFRPLTWLDSIDMVKDEPWVGFGPGSYRYTYPEFRKRFAGAGVVSGHPHNEYLEVASEYGLIGFGLFALAWCYGLIRILIFSLKTPNEHHAFMGMAFLGTAAGTMLHSFFDFQMHVFQNTLIFALLAAIVVGPICGRRQEKQTASPVKLRFKMLLPVIAVSIALVLSLGTFSSAFFRALGDRSFASKRIEQAIQYYNVAIRLDQTNWRAYLGLGDLYGVERRYTLESDKKSEYAVLQKQILEQGWDYNPKSPKLALSFGRALIFLGEKDAGIALLKEATEMRPFSDEYWWNLGLELRKANRYEESLVVFKRAQTIKHSKSSQKNIQWLERKLAESSGPDIAIPAANKIKIVIPSIDLNVETSDKSLDALHQLMEGN